jgi:ABC-2 type transport system ATP-binding protein
VSPAIAVTGLRKSYGDKVALAGVSFEVGAGEVVAVLGPNGAGKTTAVEILEGFRDRDAGSVAVLGEDPRRAGRSWRARIGLVLQSTSLEPDLTVAEVLRLFAGMYPRPRPLDELLGIAELADVAGWRIGALSGGQQRRVDLAAGIAGNPDLLFLDEPTTGFDPAARREAWATIGRLASAGTTVVLTTHYLDEAEHLADRVLVFSQGTIVADGPPGQVGRPANMTEIRFCLPPRSFWPTCRPGWRPLRRWPAIR